MERKEWNFDGKGEHDTNKGQYRSRALQMQFSHPGDLETPHSCLRMVVNNNIEKCSQHTERTGYGIDSYFNRCCNPISPP